MSAIKNPAEGTPTIRVEIYNQTYNIRSDGDSEYVIGLAEFVDRRMREISSGTLTVDSLKVAILAAKPRETTRNVAGFFRAISRIQYFHAAHVGHTLSRLPAGKRPLCQASD